MAAKSPHRQARWTVTMQLSTLPAAPQYCRCTPGVLSPFLATPVSSTQPTVPTPPAGLPPGAGRWGRARRRPARGGGVAGAPPPLDLVPHAALVPDVGGEELLERADRTPRGQGDRL